MFPIVCLRFIYVFVIYETICYYRCWYCYYTGIVVVDLLKYSHESWKSATCFSMFKHVFYTIHFSVEDCDFMQALYVTKTLDRHLD